MADSKEEGSPSQLESSLPTNQQFSTSGTGHDTMIQMKKPGSARAQVDLMDE